MTHAVVGTRQATPATVRISNGRACLVNTYRGDDLGGDATVPLAGACRADVPMDDPLLRRVPDKHGNLQRNSAALDELEGILTASPVQVRGLAIEATADMPELLLAGESLPIDVRLAGDHRAAVRVAVTSETGHLIFAGVIKPPATISVENLPPGAYTVEITGLGTGMDITPVSSTTLVWDPQLNNISGL